MVSANANSRILVAILSILLLTSTLFANFNPVLALENCMGYPVTILGTSGDDVLVGTVGNDVIKGGDGNDIIDGLDGDDVICTGIGDDLVTGGLGNDKIYGGGPLDGYNTVDAGPGDDLIDMNASPTGKKIIGGTGKDTILTGSGDDKIYGGDGADIIDAGDGANYIEGNQDTDTITSGSGDDDIYGGNGNDIIKTANGNNHVHGDSGNDIIITGSGNDDIDGGMGDDCIESGGGTDIIDGGSVINLINNGSCIASPANPVKPILECVEELGGGNYRAHFGYINENSEQITIAVGTSNKFTPSPDDRGQPTVFDIGRTDYYPNPKFSIDFDGSNLVWTLKGPDGVTRTSTASSNPAQKCSELPPSISITSPADGSSIGKGSEFIFTGISSDVVDGILSSSIMWTSDIDGPIGTGESITTTSLSVGTHVITASVTNAALKTSSISIVVIVNAEKDELVMVCHLPPGNPTNYQTLLISSSALQSHIDHGDVEGKCNDKNSEKKLVEQIVKKQREEMDKKNELKEKRNELKEIKNEIKDLKKTVKEDPELKDKVKELISEIKETLKNLKDDYDYDKEYKEEIKAEFKELKEKIQDDLTKPEKNAVHSVDSKISILSHSDDPKNDAKKLGLKYLDGLTTIAIKLTDDNQKVLQQLNSISNIEVKNDKNVQITINLKDLPKLQKLSGIENIRPPSSAIQFEELVSEGVYFMNADLAQYSGITGKGVKVAVFDLSFANNPKISENIVEVKSFRSGVSAMPSFWGGSEALHGTAVAEIITDVAPDVELYLYSMETDIEFTAAVDEAISKNIDVIAMSAGWPNFPTDGTSHITKKIEEAVENGIVFVVPAGNFGNKHWEGNFVDSNLNGWHDFSASDEGLSITVTESRIANNEPIMAYLMWNVGQYDVADFELVLVNPLGEIVDFSANKQEVSSDTNLEHIYHMPDTEGIYSLGVLYSGDMESPDNRPKASLEIFTVNDKLEYPVPQSSVSVPADAKGAIVVGAVNHLDGTLAPYSSHGPTNNGKLAPHVVGPDGVTTLALDGKPFYGTSATTPYVAGLAALILEQNPEFSPAQLLNEIEQNTEQSKFSLKNEYDFATGYGTASAIFLIQDLEVLQ